ncbi:MAG TPA: hypothetical protein VJT78_12880 [Candidatus Dormibacteraeota bacterium]|nr:hypothetical protein [Candidatus Dormibacteraeota bacterium]
MRGFLIGLFLVVALSLSVLAARPGGLRRQLHFAARRARIVLALGGVYVVGSTAIRLVFASGPVPDYGPPLLAVAMAVAFLFLGRDPKASSRLPPSNP